MWKFFVVMVDVVLVGGRGGFWGGFGFGGRGWGRGCGCGWGCGRGCGVKEGEKEWMLVIKFGRFVKD